MRKLIVLTLLGTVAVLFAPLAFSQANMGDSVMQGGTLPGSALVFPYWDKTNGLNTILRITNTAGIGPNFINSAENELLQMHIWFLNKDCLDQNFRIPFTPHDTQWVLVSTDGETWSERHDTSYQPIWDDANIINVNYGPTFDPLGNVYDSNQGFAIGFAVSVSQERGSLLIPWNWFSGEAIIQNIGLGWAFSYEALSGQSVPVPLCVPPGSVANVLDTDPPAQQPAWPGCNIAPDIDGDGVRDSAFSFVEIGGAALVHYLPLCTPDEYIPNYTRWHKFPTLPQTPLRPINGRIYNTQYVIMPWDGIFEPTTQPQNCYFFNSLTYDYDEAVISNAITMIRCWAICGLDHITQNQHLFNPSVFGWLHWTPNRTAADAPLHPRICNTTVTALSHPCRPNQFLFIYRPYDTDEVPGVPDQSLMGAWVLQYNTRWEKWNDNPDGPNKRWWAWGIYAPYMPPHTVAGGTVTIGTQCDF